MFPGPCSCQQSSWTLTSGSGQRTSCWATQSTFSSFFCIIIIDCFHKETAIISTKHEWNIRMNGEVSGQGRHWTDRSWQWGGAGQREVSGTSLVVCRCRVTVKTGDLWGWATVARLSQSPSRAHTHFPRFWWHVMAITDSSLKASYIK